MSQHALTLFEHSTIAYPWTDRDLRAIGRINAAARGTVLEAGADQQGRTLRTSSYVGLLHLNGRPIQILPKLYRTLRPGRHALPEAEEASLQTQDATANFLTMLTYAADIRIHEQGVAHLHQRSSDWFEILTGLFAGHLIDLWSRGHHRTYRSLDQTLPVLKGRWRLDEQIRRPGTGHQFDVRFDEFTGDVALNRLLRFVVERLWRITRSARNRQDLGLLRHWMDEVTLLPTLNQADVRRLQLTRLNRHYRPVLNLARLFLGHSAYQVAAGRTEAYSFLFDMNALFEGFVIGFIRRHRRRLLDPALADCRLLPQSRGDVHHFARRAQDDQPVFQLKPDLVLAQHDGYPLLLDTKYKLLKPTERRLGISQSDLYQMAAYAQSYGAPRIILLYPQTVDMEHPVHATFHLEGIGTRVEIHTVDLRRDLSRPSGIDQLKRELHTILNEE